MDIIEILKTTIPALIGVIGAYFSLIGSIKENKKEIDGLKEAHQKEIDTFRANTEKRLDKLECQKEVDTKTFQDLIRAIDRLNYHFETQEKFMKKEI